MHYKRYRRDTVRDALRAVREDLGPDALVLSTRLVPSSGLRGWMGARVVEVTAAVERANVSEERIGRTAHRTPAPSHPIAARLQASGVDPAIAQAVAAHPSLQRRGVGEQDIRRTLAGELTALTAADDEPARVEVFVGPPGVGKTTTVAKIAAQARARDAARMGLVAADGFRVGAVEQLRLYADIIGSPFFVARSGPDLVAALDSSRRPLLVDTAGRSPRDPGAADILDALAGRPDVRRHLVLPASMPAAEARRVIERFQSARPDRLLLTRLDEVDSLAPLTGVLRESQLPVSYFADGQNVPDDLARATPAGLAAWVLGEARTGAPA